MEWLNIPTVGERCRLYRQGPAKVYGITADWWAVGFVMIWEAYVGLMEYR